MRITNGELKAILDARGRTEHYILSILGSCPQSDDIGNLNAALEELQTIQDILLDNLLRKADEDQN